VLARDDGGRANGSDASDRVEPPNDGSTDDASDDRTPDEPDEGTDDAG
jgi:hypothetical protein